MKRVLLISNNVLSTIDNNGKTYASILSNYPPSSLAQIYFSECECEDTSLCTNYFSITDIDVCKSLFKRNRSQALLCNDIHNYQLSKGNKKATITRNLKKFITPFLRDLFWNLGKWYSPQLKEWIKNFNPNVIFLVSGPYNFPNKIATRISNDFQIPIVLYYTDDYVVNSIKRNLLYPLVKYRRNKFYKQIISISSKRYAIGEEMAKVYSKYFDIPFDYIMNSVDILPFSQKIVIGDIVTISYFGSLHSKRWSSIIKLSRSLPANCVIRVYTMSLDDFVKKELLKHPNIQLCGGVKGSDLTKAMQDSDFLLHVESDDLYYRRLTGLSVSTKIPEYLMASRPIIAFGPQEVASMKLLSNNRIGIPIDSTYTTEKIRFILCEVLSNPIHIYKMVERGYNYAVKKFDRQTISQKVYNDLENL